MNALRRGAPLLVAVLVAGCLSWSSQDVRYRHSRFDYWSFRGRVGWLPEPNYLPFVAHREPLPAGGEALVLCRWPDAAFPLRVRVEEPLLSGAIQDEFNPRDPRGYVQAVRRALDAWQDAIGRPVRFRVVDEGEADVVVRFRLSEEFGEPGVKVLGRVRHERQRCRVTGSGETLDRAEIEFAAPGVELALADEAGLLTPRQVQGIALHEIGHVLGASGHHSPLRGDVMFQVADDRRIGGLSEHDRNTFRALYALPPGALYARLGELHDEPPARARRTPPRLDEPVRDERFGFSVRLPEGWQRMRSTRGFVGVDGVSWDYDASIQLLAIRGRSAALLAGGPARIAGRRRLLRHEELELDGVSLTRIVVEGGGYRELTVLQDWGQDWVLMLIADARVRDFQLYEPWFERVLLSIEALP